MENTPEIFRLTDADKQSETWRRLKNHLKQELESSRIRNDGLKLTEHETNRLRGTIYAYKTLLNLDT